MLDLILTTDSRVLSTNIKTFEVQANAYLSTLTTTFDTDDDFAKAKEEVKELSEIESKIRAAIKQTQNGEIAALIETAEKIAERFRQERLTRDKLVKQKEAEIKARIAEEAISEITETRYNLARESDISLALEITMPKSSINKRIEDAQKNKRTIDGLKKAVNAEKTLIISEMSAEIARLMGRLEQVNAKYSWLFPDAVKLIASKDDLTPIIQQRIAEEEQREAEIKAKAKAEQEATAETEAVKKEIKAATETQENSTALSGELDFIVSIPFRGTKEQAIEFARKIKAEYGDGVKLNIFKK